MALWLFMRIELDPVFFERSILGVSVGFIAGALGRKVYRVGR